MKNLKIDSPDAPTRLSTNFKIRILFTNLSHMTYLIFPMKQPMTYCQTFYTNETKNSQPMTPLTNTDVISKVW